MRDSCRHLPTDSNLLFNILETPVQKPAHIGESCPAGDPSEDHRHDIIADPITGAGDQTVACFTNISGFSAHGDYNEILAWLVGFNRPPRKTFIVHGEPAASASLAEKIREKLGWNVVVPKFMQSFDLD